MGWQDLLQTENERLTAPWVGGRSLRNFDRTWSIQGKVPREHGWHEFKLKAREATVVRQVEPSFGALRHQVRGYLVGDHLVPDGARVPQKLTELLQISERVHLIEPGLERFARVSAGRFFEGGPLIYEAQDFPMGPEAEVQDAFLEGKPTVNAVSGVAPALDVAFRLESWRRDEAEKARREEQERREREERERAEAERREQIRKQLGDAQGRRDLAQFDFKAAATAALRVGGADYLDHQPTYNRGEMRVQFRVGQRRFECICSSTTMRIIDAGICLVDHDTGERGDQRFTLESLPGVIRQAERDGVLVVFRHVR